MTADRSPTSPELLAEIYRSVDHLHQTGAIPPGFEAELEDAFVKVAPPGALGGSGAALIARAEATAAINPHAPVTARSLPGTLLKRLVRKATFWYASWITEQVADFAGSMVRAARLLEGRIAAVERGERAAPNVERELARAPVDAIRAREVDVVLEAVDAGLGAVVLSDAAAVPVADLLREREAEVTIVDPRRAVFVELAAAGQPVICESVRDHLESVSEATLSALVLAGLVERSVPEVLLEITDRGARALRTGGRIVVVSTDPTEMSERATLAADLAGVRPLHHATWRHVLADRGFADVQVHPFEGRYVVVGTRGA